MQSSIALGDYAAWVADHDTLRDDDRAAIRAALGDIAEPPLFTVLMLPDAPGAPESAKLPASMLAQLYPHWELLLPADIALAGDSTRDDRIRHIDHDGGDIADFICQAARQANGRFILPITADAILAEQALFEFAMAIDNPRGADMLYSDEDRLTTGGQRIAPLFKTDWDGESALSHDLPGMLVAYRTSLLSSITGLRKGASTTEAVLFDLSLRAASRTSPLRIRHIPAILCHRAGSAAFCDRAGDPASCDGAEMREVARNFLADMKIDAEVMPAPLHPAYNRIAYNLPSPAPLVSVIIPTRDHADLLRRCVEGLLSRTDYPAIEVLIVDNGSTEAEAVELLHHLAEDPRVTVLPCPIPFNFSKLNNLAARQARGEVLVLLNNDIDVLAPSWLRELVSHAMRHDVGAVGAKLLYADGRVQHAGIVFGPNQAVTHQLRFADRLDPGPLAELSVTRTVSAVTGACLAIRRSVFFELGGLNEAMLVTYNDIDLCLRLGDHGYRVVWTPFAELLHLECATRGSDSESPEKQAFALGEAYFFLRAWYQTLQADPFHNPNMTYDLETTRLAEPPRRTRPWEASAPRAAPAAHNWIAAGAPVDPDAEATSATPRLLAKIDQMRGDLYLAGWRAEQADSLAHREAQRAGAAERRAEMAERRAEQADSLAHREAQRAGAAERRAEMAERRAEAAERLAEENQVAADSFQHRLQLSEAELQQVRAELARLLSASTVRIAMAAGRVAGLIPAPLRGVLRKILRRDA